MKPICAKCKLFFKPERNGICFEEGAPMTNDQNGPWRPYKLWMGDLWKCRRCGAEIIVGTGFNPIAVCHEPCYDHFRDCCSPVFRVDDC